MMGMTEQQNFKIIQTKAIRFSLKHKDDHSEIKHSQMFIHGFMEVFGIDTHNTGSFERYVKIPNKSHSERMDYFWENKIIIEQKSKGEDLEIAFKTQADRYHYYVEDDVRPNYILMCNFENFVLINKNKNDERVNFKLKDLHKNIHHFKFLNNIKNEEHDEIPISEKASIIMGEIYKRLKETKYKKENTEELLTRLVYCLFADDTNIFDKGIFHEYIKNNTNMNTFGMSLSVLFDTLNISETNRQTTLNNDLKKFPHINGTLFEKQIASPAFDKKMSKLLLCASEFNWSDISPAIFGSLFQNVMPNEERRSEGAHYTTEGNILKVIKPLFLDDLYHEFYKISDSANKNERLKTFQIKLSQLKFLDPACGAGNFLIIAYREIRKLELKIIDELEINPNVLNISKLIKVNVDQFYGIEKNKFSAKIAEIALWMMDHLMNNMASEKYGTVFLRIPLKEQPQIKNDDALDMDWNDLLKSSKCSYIFGNPPFSGSTTMNSKQKHQIQKLSKSGALDYVTAWFIKSAQYVTANTPIGFVATNSITQGKQVSILWNILFSYGLNITFAYTSFVWDSKAQGVARVTVIILGMSKNLTSKKRLFSFDGKKIVETNPKIIQPTLVGVDHVVSMVNNSTKSLNGLPEINFGTQPIDGGHYIFTDDTKREFLNNEPNAKKYFKLFIGAEELINGTSRWILILQNVPANELQKLPYVIKQMGKVREFRLNSVRKDTNKLADTPTKFNKTIIPTKPFLVIPGHSSEKRKYIPIAYMKPPAIASNATFVIENADVALFGLLTSKMHMVWLKNIGGKLETRYRYSAGMVYNTFPVPNNYAVLKKHAQKILDIRNENEDTNLATLYNVLTMPPDLLNAHEVLDRAVEKLYRKKQFESDQTRLQFLLERYKTMITPSCTLD